MRFSIEKLALRTIIGFKEWERKKKQDVFIYLQYEVPDEMASETDNVDDTVDYKVITKKIIEMVESADYFLIEKLASRILDIVLENPKISEATVRVEKPHALRFSKTVAVTLSREQS